MNQKDLEQKLHDFLSIVKFDNAANVTLTKGITALPKTVQSNNLSKISCR